MVDKKREKENKPENNEDAGPNVVQPDISQEPTKTTYQAPKIKIPPKILEQAAMLGIDLKQIVDWADSVEKRFSEMEAVIICGFDKVGLTLKELEPLTAAVKQANEARASQAVGSQHQGPQMPGLPGGLDIGSLLKMLSGLLNSGGTPSADSELATLGQEYGKMVLKNAIADLQNPKPNPFEEIGREVMLKVSAKRVNDAVDQLK